MAVCLYELATRADLTTRAHLTENAAAVAPADATQAKPDAAAPSADLELLASVVEEAMIAADYSPGSMQAANRHDLRLLLRRLNPNRRDSRRILGLFRRILWRLKRVPNGDE